MKKRFVQFREKGSQENAYVQKPAVMSELEDAGTSNDPVNHRFSAVLDGLKPGDTHEYRVGNKKG